MSTMRRIFGAVAIIAVVWLVPHPLRAGVNDPMAVALEIKAAIMKSDTAALSKHLKSSYFIDEPYSKQDLVRLLKEKGSWMQKNLLVGKDSVKSYFATAKDLKIVVRQFDEEDVISYQSSNYPPHMWPWCSIRPEGKSWVFSDMFAYR